LAISVPPARSYGSGFVGGSVGGPLGTVSVRDTRLINPNAWVATVSSTIFTTGGGSLPAQRISNTFVSYWSGPATRSTGGGILVPGQPTRAQAVTLGTPRTAFSKISGSGNNTVEWAPTVTITIPAGTAAGLYAGTITHSVA
jgi:hypothetical protein